MRWIQPPLDHDHLLILWWCPFLCFLTLWGLWGDTSTLGGLWIACGQVGGGLALLFAFHGWLGAEGQRALPLSFRISSGSFLPFLGGFVVVALAFASLGKAYAVWAASCLGIAVGLGIWRMRQHLLWVEEDSVWLGPFPLQRVSFAQLRHVWFDGRGVFVRDERGRGFEAFVQDESASAAWVEAILSAQQHWIEQHKEGFVAGWDGSLWEVHYGEGESFFAQHGWTFESLSEGHGAAKRWGRVRRLALGSLFSLWVWVWWSGLAASWGLSVSWGGAIFHFLLGLALCALLCALPGSWWPPLQRTWLRRGTNRAAGLYVGVVWPCLLLLLGLVVWECVVWWGGGGKPHWSTALLSMVSVVMMGLDPSGSWVWMTRVKGVPWLRRTGWRESFSLSSWECVAFDRGVLYWRQGGASFRMVLPCKVSAKEVAAWLFG